MLRTRTALRASAGGSSADVVIIGAGVIGTCTAYELLRRNPKRRVCVLDTNREGPGTGTTSYSSGIIRTFYSVPATVKIAWESYLVWREWEEYLGLPQRSRDAAPVMRNAPGFLLRSPNSSAFIDGFSAVAAECGIRVDQLDEKETAKRAATLGWDVSHSYNPVSIHDSTFGTPVPNQRITGSMWVPDTGYVADPMRATQSVAAAATALGAEFRFGAPVTAIQQDTQGRVRGVQLADGCDIETPIVVNAAGPWSSHITSLAFPDSSRNDMNLTTRPLRAECAVLDAPASATDVNVVSFDFDTGVYFRPDMGKRILVGGLDLPCDTMDWVGVDELRTMNPEFTEQWKSHVYRAALRMPTLGVPSGGRALRGVVSAYDVSEDWSPIIDASALPGYFMSIGTSGNCFKIAPLMGELTAAVVDGSDHVTLARSKLGRFPTAAFSRLRTPYHITGGVCG